jgi:hypothetical protein
MRKNIKYLLLYDLTQIVLYKSPYMSQTGDRKFWGVGYGTWDTLKTHCDYNQVALGLRVGS